MRSPNGSGTMQSRKSSVSAASSSEHFPHRVYWSSASAAASISPRQSRKRAMFFQSSGQISAAGAYYLAEIKQQKGDTELAATLANAALSTKNNYPKKVAAQELLNRLQR